MPERPHCQSRRCKVLDELVQDIHKADGIGQRCDTPVGEKSSGESSQVGIKLMCDFWKILQEDPECNLSHEVKQRMCVENCTGRCKLHQDAQESKASTCKTIRIQSSKNEPKVCRHRSQPKKQSSDSDTMPLQKALGNLKEAASFEKKCNAKADELTMAQNELVAQIQMLESKEKKGVELLKQADNMWSTMEEAYKKKLAASQERVQLLQTELKKIETSGEKWSKTKKDLNFSLIKAIHDKEMITQKINEKKNDIKVMNLEIEDFKKRKDSNANELEAIKNSYTSKKKASDAKLDKIALQMSQAQDKVVHENKSKADKEQEGNKNVKEAREKLQELCRSLLQKRIENEDLRAEKEALLLEIDLLKTTAHICTMRYANREKNIDEESKRLDKDIEGYTAKCMQCNRTTDCSDINSICIDCPRCLNQRNCLIRGDHCESDPSQQCVCARIKEKFLDNVFDNMYTVLERESKTCLGKELADGILNCLRKSKNGKLDGETRKALQEFILSTVKQNLNLTITGGAVKTRCEMDPETYQQLMLCLKDVMVTPPPKADKGISPKKEPCGRWSGSSECYCPSGPNNCPCMKTAPNHRTESPTSPTSFDESHSTSEKPDPSVKICPQCESLACGTECAMVGLPGAKDMSRKPCKGALCPLSNMRAAQCALGPEELSRVHPSIPHARSPSLASSYQSSPLVPPYQPSAQEPKTATFSSGGKEVKLCLTETKHLKAKIKDERGLRANYKKITEKRSRKSPLSDAASKQSTLNSVSSLQKSILAGDQIQKTLLEELTKPNRYHYISNDCLKVAIDSGQSNCQFTELTQTRSGNLAIKLDDQAIKILEEKSTTDPYLAMSIRTTTSGHVLLGFNGNESVIDYTQRVTVRRTLSGTTLLDVHKNMIKTLKDAISNKKPTLGFCKNPIRGHINKQLRTIDLNNIVNDKDENSYNILQLLNIKTKDNEEKLKHTSTCSKTTKDPDGCKQMSSTGLKGNTSITYVDSDLPLKSDKEPKTTDNYLLDVLNPIIQKIFKPFDHDRKEEFKSTCPEATNSRDCKLMSCTDSILKDVKKNSFIDKQALINNKTKERPTCSNAHMNTNSVSSKLITELYNPTKCLTTSSWKSSSFKRVDNSNYGSEFKKLYEQGNVNVALEIKLANGVNRNVSTVVTKTKSGTIVLYARGMASLKEISSDGKEYPVLLSKTILGTYFVNDSNNGQNSNATLKKTTSEGMLLIPKLFGNKVKLTISKNKTLELPVMLQPTPSDNYIVVLDREFENYYKAIINKYIHDKLESSIDLHTTSSGNFIIELDNQDQSHVVKRNAILVKSLSGNFKVLVQRLVQLESTSSSTSLAEASVQINSNLPASSREFHRGNLRKSKYINNVKATTETLLFDSTQLNAKPAVLKQTTSGQYAVVLNKEAKKAFLNNLQSTLKTNPEGLLPIRRLNSGEIIIDTKNKDVKNAFYGSVKITSSGNIYMVVNEEAIKDISESSTSNESSFGVATIRSRHVTQLMDSIISAIPTRSHDKPNEYFDAPSCVYTDLQFDTMDGSNDKLSKEYVGKEANADNKDKYGRAPESDTPKYEPPVIVIKPTNESIAPNNEFKSAEQCCFLFNSGLQSHQSRHNGITNKLLETSESCTADEKPKEKIKFGADSEQCAERNTYQEWDTFCNYLPLQLPAFLNVVHTSDGQ